MKHLALVVVAALLASPVLALTVPLILDVSDTFRIIEASLSDDRITPVAGSGANLTISVVTSNPASVAALFSDQVIDLVGDTSFETTLHLSSALRPGNYTITVVASTHNESASQELAFEYLPLAAVLLDVPSLAFSGLAVGKTVEIKGDALLATEKPTIWNAGNVPINIGIAADTPAAGTEKVSLSNIQVSLNGTYVPLKTAYQNFTLNLQPNATAPINFKVTIPNASSAGNYVGALKVVAR